MTRTYVITGAASGIGATTAQTLREQGHTVIGVDLKDAEVTADLSTCEGRIAAADEAAKLAGGTVDVVIACAGILLIMRCGYVSRLPVPGAARPVNIFHLSTYCLPEVKEFRAT